MVNSSPHLQSSYTYLKNFDSSKRADLEEIIGKRVFISYSRQDFPFVSELYNQISQSGYASWLDVMHIPLIGNWWNAICDGIDNCDYYILVVSPWSVGSVVVRSELERAISKNKDILLVLFQMLPEDIHLVSLNAYPWIDARVHPKTAFQKVIAYIENPDTANQKPLPVMGSRNFLNFTRHVPYIIHFNFFVTILFMYWGLSLGLQTILNPLRHLEADRILIRLFPILMGGFAVTLIGFEISRLHRFYSRSQLNFGRITSMGLFLASISVIVGFFEILFTGFTSVLIESDLPDDGFNEIMNFIARQPAYDIGLAFIAILCLVVLVFVQIFNNKTYRMWQPTYFNKAMIKENIDDTTPFFHASNNAMDALSVLQNARGLDDVSLNFIFHPHDSYFVYDVIDDIEHKVQVNLIGKHQENQKIDINVFVVSEYSMKNDVIVAHVISLINEGTPLIPLLIETVNPPEEMMFLNWFDARYNLPSVSKKLVSIISRIIKMNIQLNPHLSDIDTDISSDDQVHFNPIILNDIYEQLITNICSTLTVVDCLKLQLGLISFERQIKLFLRNIINDKYPQDSIIRADLVDFIVRYINNKVPYYFWTTKLGNSTESITYDLDEDEEMSMEELAQWARENYKVAIDEYNPDLKHLSHEDVDKMSDQEVLTWAEYNLGEDEEVSMEVLALWARERYKVAIDEYSPDLKHLSHEDVDKMSDQEVLIWAKYNLDGDEEKSMEVLALWAREKYKAAIDGYDPDLEHLSHEDVDKMSDQEVLIWIDKAFRDSSILFEETWAQKNMILPLIAPNTITTIFMSGSWPILLQGLGLLFIIMIHSCLIFSSAIAFNLNPINQALIGIPLIIKMIITELWFRRRIRYTTLFRIYIIAVLITYISLSIILDQLVYSNRIFEFFLLVFDVLLLFMMIKRYELYENWLPTVTEIRFKTIKLTSVIVLFILFIVVSIFVNASLT